MHTVAARDSFFGQPNSPWIILGMMVMVSMYVIPLLLFPVYKMIDPSQERITPPSFHLKNTKQKPRVCSYDWKTIYCCIWYTGSLEPYLVGGNPVVDYTYDVRDYWLVAGGRFQRDLSVGHDKVRLLFTRRSQQTSITSANVCQLVSGIKGTSSELTVSKSCSLTQLSYCTFVTRQCSGHKTIWMKMLRLVRAFLDFLEWFTPYWVTCGDSWTNRGRDPFVVSSDLKKNILQRQSIQSTAGRPCPNNFILFHILNQKRERQNRDDVHTIQFLPDTRERCENCETLPAAHLISY